MNQDNEEEAYESRVSSSEEGMLVRRSCQTKLVYTCTKPRLTIRPDLGGTIPLLTRCPAVPPALSNVPIFQDDKAFKIFNCSK